MTPFIRNDQYNFIKYQTQILVNGHSSSNDRAVLQALKSLAVEKVLYMFLEESEEQKQLLNPISEIKDKEQAEAFLNTIKPFVMPFEVSEQQIKKLFPKVKKLKVLVLEGMNLREISYLGWDDKGSQKKYIVTYHEGKLTGLQGTCKPLNKKGICVLCNKIEEVGLFMTEKKGTVQGTFTKRGNYICLDSQKCNHNLITLDKLDEFLVLSKQ